MLSHSLLPLPHLQKNRQKRSALLSSIFYITLTAPLLIGSMLIGQAAAQTQAQTQNFNHDRPTDNLNPIADYTHNETSSDRVKRPVVPAKQSGEAVEIEISTQGLENNPALLMSLLQTVIAENNIPAMGALLPAYKRLPEHYQDPMLIHYMEGMVAKEHLDYSKAIAHFNAMLEETPDLPKIEVSLLEANLANRAHRDAEEIIEKLERYPLDDGSREALQSYQDYINKRESFEFDLGLNYTEDRNINGAPPIGANANGFVSITEAESAHGISYFFSAKKDYNLSGQHYFRTKGELYGQYYWDNRTYNEVTARVYAGYGYQTFGTSIFVTPFYEKRWFSQKPYAHSVGLRVSVDQMLSPKWQWMNMAEFRHETYDQQRNFLDGDRFMIATTLLYAPSNDQFFFAGLDFSKESPSDESDQYIRRGIRVGWGKQWPNEFSTNVQASYAKRAYKGEDITRIQRRQDEYTLSLSVWKRDIEFWGITPKLSVNWQKTSGNHPLYNYDRFKWYLDFSRAL
ncbi:surface lipoprotein assembly modifier [Ignatzschineria sp. RMDPL8A]|uniref:surface lipoprotein assembly modifier n=1 Tax=Ignatzschineria sp. RMDPL8A TaxID=2999236 RepID=UPI0016944C3C|nr:surface lipoprotein assembly modifier [Ignatzschineria sp. RMDPL8A]MDG9730549.1 surface lipoprotein assembly modifier [Ignatzschineria sp. RMDPL8A]NLD09226.1 DUF560 domain-containing protein [Xanthomonadaceae bacterium]